MNFLNHFKENKKNLFKKSNVFYIAVITFIFTLDRISKNNIINNFSERTYYINDFINLDLIWNIGIGFGILSTESIFFYNLITFLICLVILLLMYILISSKNIDKLIYSVIIGGALGNFYDRLLNQAVPDFIDLHYNNFHWFTFNVADIFITTGILIFILRGFFIKN